MNAVRMVDSLAADLDTKVRESVALVVRPFDLSGRREADIRAEAHRVVLGVLAIEDSLAVKAIELEAAEARANRHVQQCGRCWWWVRRQEDCSEFRALTREIECRQAAYDRQFRRLVALRSL